MSGCFLRTTKAVSPSSSNLESVINQPQKAVAELWSFLWKRKQLELNNIYFLDLASWYPLQKSQLASSYNIPYLLRRPELSDSNFISKPAMAGLLLLNPQIR